MVIIVAGGIVTVQVASDLIPAAPYPVKIRSRVVVEVSNGNYLWVAASTLEVFMSITIQAVIATV